MSLPKNTIEGRAEPFLQRIESLLVDTLGELGAAAARRAGHTPKGDGDDDDRDLRPPYLRHPDAASEASAR